MKCLKCGTEFEGNFCSNCGAKREEGITCPKCGTKLSKGTRFCSECGCSLIVDDKVNTEEENANKVNTDKVSEEANFNKVNEEKPNKAKKLATQTGKKQKIFLALRFVPFGIFALFSVLLFAFFSAPVAELAMGMGFPNESFGNVYSMHSGLLSMIPELEGSMIALIIFAVLSVVFASLMSLTLFLPKFKYKDVTILGKWRQPLSTLMAYISFIFYLIFFIIGISIVSIIASVDGGMGGLVAGACPVTIIVFSVIFAMASAGAMFGRLLLAKKFPDVLEYETKQKEKYFAEEKARREKFYATHSAPIAPIKGKNKKQYRKELIIYKHAKRKYDKASDKKTPAAVIWLDLHKAAIITLVVYALIIVFILTVIKPIATDRFRLSNVESIELGAPKYSVIGTLGEPTRKNSAETSFYWYDSKVDEKLAEIEKFEESADFSESSLTQLAKMYEELEAMEYKYIFVRFDSEGKAIEVFLDTNHRYSDSDYSEDGKVVKNVNLLFDKLEAYIDNDYKVIANDINNAPYQAYYTDGSYYLSTAALNVTFGEGNRASFNWNDPLASYNISKSYETVSSYLSPQGTLYINENINESAYAGNNEIKSVVVGSQVSSIGDGAFSGCASLSTVNITGEISTIGEKAFKGCRTLTSINLPNSISKIEGEAFSGCEQLKLNQYDNGLYLGNDENKYLVLVKAASNSIVSCRIPDGTKIVLVGDAFENCSSLANITVDEGNMYYSSSGGLLHNKNKTELSYVPQGAKTVGILNSVSRIGDYAFKNYPNMKNFTITENITYIGVDAFYGCDMLSEFTVSAQNKYYKSIDGNLYNYNGDTLIKYAPGKKETEFTTPDGVLKIEEHAFYNCKKIENIVISEGLISIGDEAFLGCSRLTSITIPTTATEFGDLMFGDRVYIENAIVPTNAIDLVASRYLTTLGINGGTTIEANALWCAYGLRNLVLGDSITTIEDLAFGACYNLLEVTLGRNVSLISPRAFLGCAGIEKFIVDENNQYFKSIDGVLYSYDAKTLVKYTYGNDRTSFEIPDGVTTIGAYAFEASHPLSENWSVSLTSVTIPTSVTTIEMGAFEFDLRQCTSHITEIIFEDISNWELGKMQPDKEKIAKTYGLTQNDSFWVDSYSGRISITRAGQDKVESFYIYDKNLFYFERQEGISADLISNSSTAATYLIDPDEYSTYYWIKK